MSSQSVQNLTRGIIRENPTFVMLLGMCPTLGVTTSAGNGLGMGLATLFVLILSNSAISLVKNLIPAMVRIPCYIVIIASFVTVVDLLMAAYLPELHAQLGIFIPLIVVNCIILGRAEAFAAKAPVGIGFDGQSDDFAVTANRIHCQAFVIRGGNVGSFRKRIVVKSFGDDFGNGAEFKVIFDRFNRRLGFAVDIGQYQGRQRADDDQSRGHIEKV